MAIVLGMLNKKGGSGKSTITKLLASAIVFSDHKCLVIDLDPNRDILTWWTSATALGNYDERLTVRATVNSEELFDIVADHEHKVGFILIDTKGEGGDWAENLASVADRLIVPCMNAKSDSDRTKETMEWHADLIERSDKPEEVPPLHIVMTRLPPNVVSFDPTTKPNNMTVSDWKRLRRLISELRPLKTLVPERSQYREMDDNGLLGTILQQARDGEGYNKGQAQHFESALAHATDLMNSILEGSVMEQFDGS